MNSFIDVILSEGVSKSKLCQIFSFYPSLLVNMKLKQGVMKNIELFIRFFTYFFVENEYIGRGLPFPAAPPDGEPPAALQVGGGPMIKNLFWITISNSC